MASLNSTNNLFQSQSKVLWKVFEKTTPEAPPIWDRWFNSWEGDPERSFFQILPFYGFGPLALKYEGQAPALDQAGEGTASMFPYSTYSLKYGITQEANDEDPMKINGRLPRLLRFAEDQTVELLLWNQLNQAFNSNVTIWDGQPLCSTAHPLASTPGITYSNSLGAVALTPETLQQTEILMATLPDDRNLATYRTPKMLILPPPLQKTGEEIIGSAYYPYTNENRINVQQDKLEPLVVRYLTYSAAGPYPWFVTAGKGDPGADAHLVFVSFKHRHRQKIWLDEDTGNIYHKTEMRLTQGAADGRGIVGSQGA